MESLIILILKCLLLGIIWAALLIPVIFNRGGWLKYLITVLVIALLCFLLRSWAGIINRMTVIALITLVISWITSMAVFDKESKIKSKVISFACVMSAAAYLISTWVYFDILWYGLKAVSIASGPVYEKYPVLAIPDILSSVTKPGDAASHTSASP